VAYREFRDSQGKTWEVWEVRPAAIERRQADDRRRYPREFSDRRSTIPFRLLGGMKDGWLTFQSGNERRRLSPIPEGWAALSDATLRELAAKAELVARTSLSSRIAGFGATPPSGEPTTDPDPELF
jgi:hypothetical protein